MPESIYLTRRRFALSAVGALTAPWFAARGATADMPWSGPAVVRKVYLCGKPSWPSPDADVDQNIAAVEAKLKELERMYPGQIRLTGGERLNNAAEMTGWLQKPDDADVVLAFNMVTIVHPMLKQLVESGKPTLMFAQPYYGHDWTHAAAYIQRGAKLDLIASSDFRDLDGYLPIFRAIHQLRRSKVLLVSPLATRPKVAGDYSKQFGTEFAYPSYLDLKSAFDASDPGQADKLAAAFIKEAAVVEPSRQEIVDSMRLYLGIRKYMEQEKANAIAIDCLGGFGRRELPAYPCVAFSKLNDVGLYGVCENDLESTMTQLLVTSFSGVPGFVSDPVFDTSRNEVIHAHCVSATKLEGIDGKASPYMVRSHLEDHKGVSMQVLAPSGGAVTVAKFADARRLMVSTGEVLGNVDDERGCRTKIRTKVKDSGKLLRGWAAALDTPAMPGTRDLLHRVVFYGDHTGSIERLGRLTGFKVVREG